MERDSEIEALLNAARDKAIRDVDGMPATREILELAGAVARDALLLQAELGLWRKWSISSGQELAAVKCTFELVPPTLIPGPPIRVRWNFTHTPLWFLETH